MEKENEKLSLDDLELSEEELSEVSGGLTLATLPRFGVGGLVLGPRPDQTLVLGPRPDQTLVAPIFKLTR